MFALLDANGDGVIDRHEWEAALGSNTGPSARMNVAAALAGVFRTLCSTPTGSSGLTSHGRLRAVRAAWEQQVEPWREEGEEDPGKDETPVGSSLRALAGLAARQGGLREDLFVSSLERVAHP